MPDHATHDDNFRPLSDDQLAEYSGAGRPPFLPPYEPGIQPVPIGPIELLDPSLFFTMTF